MADGGQTPTAPGFYYSLPWHLQQKFWADGKDTRESLESVMRWAKNSIDNLEENDQMPEAQMPTMPTVCKAPSAQGPPAKAKPAGARRIGGACADLPTPLPKKARLAWKTEIPEEKAEQVEDPTDEGEPPTQQEHHPLNELPEQIESINAVPAHGLQKGFLPYMGQAVWETTGKELDRWNACGPWRNSSR